MRDKKRVLLRRGLRSGRRFNHSGRLIWREVEQAKLIELLRFDVDPDSLRPIGFSRNAADGSFLMKELDDRGQLIPVPTFKGV